MPKIRCTECHDVIEDDGGTYCGHCYEKRDKELDRLTDEIFDLQDEIRTLKEKIASLQKARPIQVIPPRCDTYIWAHI